MTLAQPFNVPLPDAFSRGRYRARFAATEADLRATQELRHLCFVDGAGRAPLPDGIEADQFDERCDHVMIESRRGTLLCSYRVMPLTSGAQLYSSNSAYSYNLERLSDFDQPMIELGRFCIHPDARDPDILRIAWGMLAAYVDVHKAGMLFGCSSFAGAQRDDYRLAFDLLAARHLAPDKWHIGHHALETVPYTWQARPVRDHRAAMAQVPSLLKTYLSMGGWVSDHAVIDREMNTLHVFTGLEIAAIPPARAKALRAVAGAEPPAGV